MIPWSAFRGQSLSTNNWWRIARFFASSSAWRSGNGPANFFVAESDGGVSSVYRNALKYTRPPTIKWKERIHLHNSVSFIGSVERPPKTHATRFGTFGIYTVLVVKSSRDSLSSFRILIEMWGEMAEIAFQHLKPDDFICVSGHLGSYEKVFENGNHRIFYKVTVKGLNYVKQHANFHKVEKLESLDGEPRSISGSQISGINIPMKLSGFM
ncbi:hypothetical protein Nepgr_025056 [Nepenthes gracilis]|uniref:Uncharacterized protein n=1 Tax=Nepenthes gracilis TaxID=150966 RepID=A0AAD3T5H5_NEPGR|nr:hypothetical protein Nepgr_025056 [Nepenthes gracilis]